MRDAHASVCRCGAGPHPTERDACARGHVLAGNQRTVTHGLYSYRARGAATLPPDLKVSIDQFRDDLVGAQGGLEELDREPVRAGLVRLLVDAEVGRKLLMNEIVKNGVHSRPGRAAYDRLLQTTDRWLRIAAALGSERRPRQVMTIAEQLAAMVPVRGGSGVIDEPEPRTDEEPIEAAAT